MMSRMKLRFAFRLRTSILSTRFKIFITLQLPVCSSIVDYSGKYKKLSSKILSILSTFQTSTCWQTLPQLSGARFANSRVVGKELGLIFRAELPGCSPPVPSPSFKRRRRSSTAISASGCRKLQARWSETLEQQQQQIFRNALLTRVFPLKANVEEEEEDAFPKPPII